jgi:hypothetical protein
VLIIAVGEYFERFRAIRRFSPGTTCLDSGAEGNVATHRNGENYSLREG